MGGSRHEVRFVLSSAVRTSVLQGCEDRPTTTNLLDRIDASTSAVYDALGELEERGLIRSSDGEWQLTGTGQILVDLLSKKQRFETVLEEAGGYFDSHDATALPRTFRFRIDELTGLSVVAATETEPHRAVATVSDRLERSDQPRVIAPVVTESYMDAMPHVTGSKLLLDEQVVVSAVESGYDPDQRDYTDIDIRIADVDIALAVTDEALLLSLPTLDGQYDSQTELIVETERARQWGLDLFDALWTRADPAEAVLRRLD